MLNNKKVSPRGNLEKVDMPLFTRRKQDKKAKVVFSGDLLLVEFDGGKPQVFPLDWFPALKSATDEERADWDQTDKGIRFNKLNLDINTQ
ncbi:DUF2442 domain-containing protein [Mucilaginibacter panaciglaebae]|uniref:DUF2442 domain-containing protein n=1 Tax=Mucilaginibacter panaciglaebae TaxID=502331 RepID=A0ABP7X0N5_9SPHI